MIPYELDQAIKKQHSGLKPDPANPFYSISVSNETITKIKNGVSTVSYSIIENGLIYTFSLLKAEYEAIGKAILRDNQIDSILND
jgi:hypothetical protein